MEFSTAITTTLHELIAGLEPGDADLHDPLEALLRDANLAVGSFLGLQLVWVVDGQPLRLTVLDPSVHAGDIVTSLRLPLAVLSPAGTARPQCRPSGHDRVEDTLTFYAGVPGAFVDLAADLSYALGLPDPDVLSVVADRADPATDGPPAASDGVERSAGPHDGSGRGTGNGGWLAPGPGAGSGTAPDSAAGDRAGRLLLDQHLTPATLVSGIEGRAELTVIHQAAGVLIERGHAPDDAVRELRRRSLQEGLSVHGYAAQLLHRAVIGQA